MQISWRTHHAGRGLDKRNPGIPFHPLHPVPKLRIIGPLSSSNLSFLLIGYYEIKRTGMPCKMITIFSLHFLEPDTEHFLIYFQDCGDYDIDWEMLLDEKVV
jgi:hypothetical protein